jgi:ABC-type transport system involved in multi-copper enzyme maturation permease subunit
MAIALLSLGSLMLIDGCTTCSGGEVTINGEARSVQDLGGAVGTLLIVVLGLWTCLLAGVLGTDHLQQTLEDGSASLCLSRPISRRQFALARLAGALSVALIPGLVLLAAAAGLLHLRGGLPLGPAMGAGVAYILGATTCGAIGMTVSLAMPRLASLLVVFACVGLTTLANVAAHFDPGPGLLATIHQAGPPLAASIWTVLDPWIDAVSLAGDTEPFTGIPGAWLRLGVWTAGSIGALLWTFERQELRS